MAQRLHIHLLLFEAMSHLAMARPGVWGPGVPMSLAPRFNGIRQEADDRRAPLLKARLRAMLTSAAHGTPSGGKRERGKSREPRHTRRSRDLSKEQVHGSASVGGKSPRTSRDSREAALDVEIRGGQGAASPSSSHLAPQVEFQTPPITPMRAGVKEPPPRHRRAGSRTSREVGTAVEKAIERTVEEVMADERRAAEEQEFVFIAAQAVSDVALEDLGRSPFSGQLLLASGGGGIGFRDRGDDSSTGDHTNTITLSESSPGQSQYFESARTSRESRDQVGLVELGLGAGAGG